MGANRPAVQSVHPTPLTSALRPVGQPMQEDAPVASMKVPGAQDVHEEAPVVDAKRPALQSVHDEAPMVDEIRTENVPSPHGVHAELGTELSLTNVPGLHAWHTAWPVAAVYVPMAQLTHDD